MASWLALSDHLLYISNCEHSNRAGYLRSSDKVVNLKFGIDLLAQLRNDFLFRDIALLLQDRLSLSLNPDRREVVYRRIELARTTTYSRPLALNKT